MLSLACLPAAEAKEPADLLTPSAQAPGQLKKELVAILEHPLGAVIEAPAPARALASGSPRPKVGGAKRKERPDRPAKKEMPSPAPITESAPQPSTAAAQPAAGGSSPVATSGGRAPSRRRGASRTPAPQGGVSAVRSAVFGAVLRPVPFVAGPADSGRSTDRRERRGREPQKPRGSVVTRTVREIVKVVPGPIKAVLAAMGALIAMLAAGYLLVTLRARRLSDQRGELLREIGLLQAALLPEVPSEVGLLRTSVAYRPAEGPGAGGDFYDAFPLDRGRVGIVVGDVAGHGRGALGQTTLLRYTLRVYLETGLDPRAALKLAGRTLDQDDGASFVTAIVAVYDAGEGTLTYACAGHPPPVLLGPPRHEPIIVSSSPPIGIGMPTGLRQTTVPLPPDALACFFTDGLVEARLEPGLLGRDRLSELLAALGPDATATALLARIREESAQVPDDMAACVVRPLAESFAPDVRIEELELGLGEPIEPALERFLDACGVPAAERPALRGDASSIASRWGGVLVLVRVATSGAEVSLFAPHVNAFEAALL